MTAVARMNCEILSEYRLVLRLIGSKKMHVLIYGLWFRLPVLTAPTATGDEVMHSFPGLWGLLSFVFEV